MFGGVHIQLAAWPMLLSQPHSMASLTPFTYYEYYMVIRVINKKYNHDVKIKLHQFWVNFGIANVVA